VSLPFQIDFIIEIVILRPALCLFGYWLRPPRAPCREPWSWRR